MSWMKKRISKVFGQRAQEERDFIKRYVGDVSKNQMLAERLIILEQCTRIVRTGLEYDEKTGAIVKRYSVDERLAELDRMLRVGAIAWGRGGDRWVFAKMMMCWENLYGVWEDVRSMKAQHEERVTAERSQLVELEEKLQRYMEKAQRVQSEMYVTISGQIEAHQTPVLDRLMEVRELLGIVRNYIYNKQLKFDDLVDNFGMRELVPWGLKIVDVSFLSMDVAGQYTVLMQSMKGMMEGMGGFGQQGMQPFYKSKYGQAPQPLPEEGSE